MKSINISANLTARGYQLFKFQNKIGIVYDIIKEKLLSKKRNIP